MAKTNVLFTIVLLFDYLVVKFASGCGDTPWVSRTDLTCADYKLPVSLYQDVMPNGDNRWTCCPVDHPAIEPLKENALSCIMSQCSKTPSKNHCPERIIDGKSTKFEEIFREECTTKKGEPGYTSDCCPENSLDGQLASAFGAEVNEFPHMAKLFLPEGCGGTIYNERYIITAAHCLVEKDYSRNNASEMRVVIGSNSGANINEIDSKYVYEVEEAIVHWNYSKISSSSPTKNKYLNDIALLKLKKDITFGDNVKALEIAGKDYEPRDYADQGIIAGWGTTDTMKVSIHLQKTNVLLRNSIDCFSLNKLKEKPKWGPHFHYEEDLDQLLCVGGIMDGKWSPTAGKGDSGGPAICRGENGKAVLCGVTSFGGASDANCLKNNNEEDCPPSVYARVSFFKDWIKEHAGAPLANEEYIYRPYLYGQEVPKGDNKHQVRIISKTGKSCGGTLISEDVVITAASCVANDDGTEYEEIKVQYGLSDLKNNDSVQTYDVSKTKIFDGFERVGEKVSIEGQGNRVRITDNYYKNNLAVVKINGRVPIGANELPRMAGDGEIFGGGNEFAFPRNIDHGGKLLKRDFNILEKDECKKRMKRLEKMDEEMGGASTQVSEDILCGVEKYSGGSICDRELGGGLICKGEGGGGGKDVLCGVQVFRRCDLSLPNKFMDMGMKKGWVERAVKSLG